MSVDLLELAPHGRWMAGELTDDHAMAAPRPVPFQTGHAGGAQARLGPYRLEDGHAHDVLLTCPPAGRRTTIRGWLPRARLPEHAVFDASIGYLVGAPAAAAVFQVWAYELTPDGVRSALVTRVRRTGPGALTRVRGDLSFLGGRDVALELRMDLDDPGGVPTPAAWVAPAVVAMPPPPTLESLARAWSPASAGAGPRAGGV